MSTVEPKIVIDPDHWMTKAAADIAELFNQCNDENYQPPLKEIIAIIDKYFQEWRSLHDLGG